MTKFILHGGGTNKPLEANKQFFAEILSNLSHGSRVLLVYLARDEQDWASSLEQDKLNFSSELEIKLEVADPNPEKLAQQIKSSDAVYVKGGNTFRLLEKIKQLPNFSELIKGKVYAGSSAGMYLVCKYFYENDADKTGTGLGILPIMGLAHWSQEKQDNFQKLQNVDKNLPVVKLPESQFVVLEQ